MKNYRPNIKEKLEAIILKEMKLIDYRKIISENIERKILGCVFNTT